MPGHRTSLLWALGARAAHCGNPRPVPESVTPKSKVVGVGYPCMPVKTAPRYPGDPQGQANVGGVKQYMAVKKARSS